MSETKWFADPRGDAHTNEVIARLLADSGEARVEVSEIDCKDGETRKMWPLPSHKFVDQLERSRKELVLRHVIYTKEGGGKARPWRFTKHRNTIRNMKKSGLARKAPAPAAP